MKLDYIQIDAFKNLRDFKFNFDEKSAGLVTVLLGRNGSGKSNLLEALVIIFRDLYLGHESDFGYELRYTLGKGVHQITVINRPGKTGKERFSFTAKDGEYQHNVSRSELKDSSGHRWLPKHIFAYYSGPSDRLEQHFRQHQKIFDKELREGKDRPLRPLFYARPVHSQFVLLSFFNSDDKKVKSFLEEYLLIESLESALFVLHEPDWPPRKDGDSRFWGAYGVVAKFLGDLFDCALAPMRMSPHSDTPPERKKRNTKLLYLYLKDREALRRLAPQGLEPSEFFKRLESTYIAKLIQQVRIRVRVKHCNDSLTFRELSEGEQQLLTVVGLLRFTKETDSLFLLDEPDTHLNPAWGMKYLETLNKIAEPGSDSQVLMATHDPLVLADLKRNQVIVMDRNAANGNVRAFQPDIDPQGLGVDGILRSELFGLPTTIGAKVEAKLLERDKLLAKQDKLNAAEKERMRLLSGELAAMGFATEFRDPKFELFMKALARRREREKPDLSTDDLKRQEKIADEILDELFKEGKK
jgi:predicted ATPase